MISLKNATFYYEDIVAVDDISFEVKKGEKVVLLGSNGSGKSTLLRILAGLYTLKKGEFFLDGVKIEKKNINRDFRKKVGILFQNPESMIFNPTVFDEISFSLKEFDFDNIEQRVENIAEKFGIKQLLHKNPLNLSGGEKQKVVLASIVVYEPEVILLDEPTAAMDPKTSGWFVDMIADTSESVIVATHDLNVAYEISDRAVVVDEKHKMIYDGDIEELFGELDLLQRANLIHKHRHKHKNFSHSHYHLH